MWTGVQWTGTLGPSAQRRWFTWGWPVNWHVVLEWSVSVERASATQCTYWITVKNLTSSTVTFEGRYAVLS
jgi:hypothetical protein